MNGGYSATQVVAGAGLEARLYWDRPPDMSGLMQGAAVGCGIRQPCPFCQVSEVSVGSRHGDLRTFRQVANAI
jgi:hypothetical protein